MEDTIRLTELLAAMIRAWKKVCAVALVFAMLLGAFQLYRQVSLAHDDENSPEKIEERYQEALSSFEEEKEDMEEQLASQEKSLRSKRAYLENSILLNIDPYDKYTSYLIFAITDIDGSGFQQLYHYPETPADYLLTTIRSQYIELWRRSNVSRDIGIEKYSTIEEKYWSEVVSVYVLDGGLLAIEAVAGSAAEAEKLTRAVYNYFESNQSIISKSAFPHSFSIVNQATKNTVDEDLASRRKNLEDEAESLQTEIEEKREKIAALSVPEREEGYPTSTIIKSVAQYAVLGLVAGTFLACLWVCCGYVFRNRLISSYQLERTISAPFFGSLAIECGFFDRLANRIVSERVWFDQEKALTYIKSQVKATLPEGSSLLLLSTLPEKSVETQKNELCKAFCGDGFQVESISDVVHAPNAAQAIQTSGPAIFVEQLDHSDIAAIQDTVARVKAAKNEILGFIII